MRLINANELIKRYGDFYTEEGTEEGIICSVKDLVDMIPTVEIERKTGEWIPIRYRTVGNHRLEVEWECDNCGKKVSNKFRYCPDCGVKMKVE